MERDVDEGRDPHPKVCGGVPVGPATGIRLLRIGDDQCLARSEPLRQVDPHIGHTVVSGERRDPLGGPVAGDNQAVSSNVDGC